MICEKCGKEIGTVMVNMFNRDGSDSYYTHSIAECEKDAVVIDTEKSWTGYELSEEEQLETIACPYCREFPFKNEEIHVLEFVRIICFKKEGGVNGRFNQQEGITGRTGQSRGRM